MAVTLMLLLHVGHAATVGAVDWAVPLVVLATGLVPYLIAATARSRRGRPWSPWRSASWTAGTIGVAVALSPAMALIAEGARGHMAQHVLLGMLAPIGLVLGAPVMLLLGVLPTAGARQVTSVLRSTVFRVVSHPVAAATLMIGGLLVLYLTPLHAASTTNATLHHAIHVHFLASGYLFTWAIAGPDPAPHRPSFAVRLVVLLVSAAAHSVLAKFLYARADTLPPGTDHPVADLEAAAQWMYYGGDVTELLLAAMLFGEWLRRRSPRPRPALGGLPA